MATDKAGRPLGPTGEAVRANIKRIRGDKLGIPVTELSRRLEALGRPIPPLGLRRIEDGTRRVDVDDLASLAVALNVSPISLLVPLDSTTKDELVTATAVSDGLTAEDLWKWMRADRPLGKPIDAMALLDFIKLATPVWRSVQYAEGVKSLLELNQIEQDMQSDDAAATVAARLRLEDMRNRFDGDDQ